MIADRTRDKMQQRAQRGLWNGGVPPYGYRKKEKSLLIQPEESRRVRFMFQWFSQNRSLAGLRDLLNGRGWFTRAGKRWGKTSLDNILRNPIYIGKVQFNGVIFPGQHKAIIGEALFAKVQSLRRDYSHVTTRMERCFR